MGSTRTMPTVTTYSKAQNKLVLYYQFFSSKRNMFLFCVSGTLCLTYLSLDFNILMPFVNRYKNLALVNGPRCENSPSSLLNGKWVQRNLTFSEESEIDLFLLKARTAHHIPATLQRPDLKCGNVTFDWLVSGLHPLLWFRALCSPKGNNPCCFHGRCVQASVEQCRCEQCYDMRQQIHAEYSSWVPSNSKCHLKISMEEACTILNGALIEFIGDSFIRHVYTAMVIFLNDDLEYGALVHGSSSITRTACRGMNMFTEKRCRLHLNRNTRVCNGTVSLNMREQISAAYGPSLSILARTMAQRTKSLLFLGIGIHENYKAGKTISKFLKPMLNIMYKNEQKWPRILWAGVHAPGLLKTPRISAQDGKHVVEYNTAVNDYLKSWNIPVMDTFNMTKGVMSFDGAHYGVGVNLVKARIVLHYIKELQNRGVWT